MIANPVQSDQQRKLPAHIPCRSIPHAVHTLLTRLALYGTLLLGCLALGACSSAAITTGKVAEFALSAVGIKLPGADTPEAAKTVELHVVGAEDLNASTDGLPLSTVLRVYKLRDQTGFLALPYTDFGVTALEKASLGSDLVDVRELILSPGQTLDFKEKMAGDVRYLGIVALFRSPAPRRWRFAFALAKGDNPPITVDVHACAMTAAGAIPVGTTVSDIALLSPAVCK